MNDNRKAWTNEEDQAIISIVQILGLKNWPLVSQAMKKQYQLQGRTGKQCRERWHNHLAPQLNKMPWTSEQEQLLFFCHRKYGNKWIEISKYFEGRTDNSIKNHFYSTIRRSMRRICKILGNKNSTSRLRNIRPSVLSQIFQFSKAKSKQQLSLSSKVQKSEEQEQKSILQNLEIQVCLLQFAHTKPYKDKNNLQIKKQQLELLVEELVILNQQYIHSKTKSKDEVPKGRRQSLKRYRRMSQDSQKQCENQKSTQQVYFCDTFKNTIENGSQSEKQQHKNSFQNFQNDSNQEIRLDEQNYNFYLSKQNRNYSQIAQNQYERGLANCFIQNNESYEQFSSRELQGFQNFEGSFLTIRKMPIHQHLAFFEGSFNDEMLGKIQCGEYTQSDLMKVENQQLLQSALSISNGRESWQSSIGQQLQHIQGYFF